MKHPDTGYLNFRRAVVDPYWTPNPLAWRDGNAGIAFFALEGRAGMFNLAWLIVNEPEPCSALTYRQRDIAWVIQNSATLKLGGRSLEAHAAMKCLSQFASYLQVRQEVRYSQELQLLLRNARQKERINDLRR